MRTERPRGAGRSICFVGRDQRVILLDRTRLPGKATPATVGAGAKVGGGAVIAGMKVGEGAFVAAGETVEDDVPDGAVRMGGRVAAQFEGKTWD